VLGTWGKTQESGEGSGGKKREDRADDGAPEDLGGVPRHQATLAEDSETEGQYYHPQEAHEDVATTHHPHPLPA
jgi:hypothetical protein